LTGAGRGECDLWGSSFISNPDGQIIKQASPEVEEVTVCTLDLTYIEESKKRFSFPYRDRRIDSYQDLLKLYSK